jgi:hypothetical protein
LFCEIPRVNGECQDDGKILYPPQGPPYNLCPYEKKNDLLCKNPGFQDSPIAMSRTCKIALKPLETSYSVLAG